MTALPTRADVMALLSGDDHTARRDHWVLVWCPPEGRWRLVYDPPSRETET